MESACKVNGHPDLVEATERDLILIKTIDKSKIKNEVYRSCPHLNTHSEFQQEGFESVELIDVSQKKKRKEKKERGPQNSV